MGDVIEHLREPEAELHKTHKMIQRRPLSAYIVDLANDLLTSLSGYWGDRGFTIAVRK
jgi:hypothetical protein